MLDFAGEEHRNQNPTLSLKNGETSVGPPPHISLLKMTTGHELISLAGRGAVPASGRKPRP
jgi:hypothetical protein